MSQDGHAEREAAAVSNLKSDAIAEGKAALSDQRERPTVAVKMR